MTDKPKRPILSLKDRPRLVLSEEDQRQIKDEARIRRQQERPR